MPRRPKGVPKFDEPVYQRISSRIMKLIRKHYGDVWHFSLATGIHHKQVWETIREPDRRTLRTLKKIAQGLGLSLDELLEP